MEQIRSLNQNFSFKSFSDSPKTNQNCNLIYSTVSNFKPSVIAKSLIQKRTIKQTTLKKKSA